MNPEWKAKWLEALRSGKYEQGREQLRDDGFCCLGVLCDVVDPDGWRKAETNVGEQWEHRGYWGNLSDKVREVTELRDSNPGVTLEDKLYMTLAEVNDSGKSFAEIADIIEAQL